MNPETERISARQIVEEVRAATAAPKCHKCGCFHSALKELDQALPNLPPDAQGEIRMALEVGAEHAIPEEYACLGCSVCWPANALNLASQAFPEAALAGETACLTKPPAQERSWPPLPGNYRVLDFAGDTAICVLTSESLIEVLAAVRPSGVAIIGALYTENLGIERLITNTLANPSITTLVVCGADSRQRIGHLPGQTLLSLMTHGVDGRRRIVGAEGRRPLIQNLSLELIDAFRREIAVVGRVGEEDPATIVELLRSLPRNPSGRRTRVPDGEGPMPVRAEPPARLVLDPRGYFIVFPDRVRGLIRVENYESDGRLAHLFEGERSTDLYATIIAHELVSRLDHAAYLGQELARAERALASGEPYVQDQAPEPTGHQGCECS